MIKLTIAALLAVAVYVALGAVLPATGTVFLAVPALAAIPYVGHAIGAITFKGLAAAVTGYLLAAKL